MFRRLNSIPSVRVPFCLIILKSDSNRAAIAALTLESFLVVQNSYLSTAISLSLDVGINTNSGIRALLGLKVLSYPSSSISAPVSMYLSKASYSS